MKYFLITLLIFGYSLSYSATTCQGVFAKRTLPLVSQITKISDIPRHLFHSTKMQLTVPKTSDAEFTQFLGHINAVIRKTNSEVSKNTPSFKRPYSKKSHPLHYAVQQNNYAEAEKILKQGKNPDVTDKEGHTPLYVAARLNRPKMVRLLASYNANPYYFNQNANDKGLSASSPVFLAMRLKHLKAADAMVTPQQAQLTFRFLKQREDFLRTAGQRVSRMFQAAQREDMDKFVSHSQAMLNKAEKLVDLMLKIHPYNPAILKFKSEIDRANQLLNQFYQPSVVEVLGVLLQAVLQPPKKSKSVASQE